MDWTTSSNRLMPTLCEIRANSERVRSPDADVINLPAAVELPVPGFGDRFNRILSSTLDHLNQLLTSILSQFDVPRGYRILVCIDDRPATNASAFHSESGTYAVSISLGLCVWAYHAAADVGSLNEVALDTFRDTRTLATGAYELCASVDELAALVARIEKGFPESNEGFVDYVFSNIISTVCFHETAHIVRGHVDFLGTKRGEVPALVDERALHMKATSAAITVRRELEFDADDFGAYLCTMAILDPEISFPAMQRTDQTENLVFAIVAYTMFCLSLEEDDIEIGERADSYPKPFVRLSTYIGRMQQIYNAYVENGESFQVVIRKAFGVLSECENLFPGMDELRRFSQATETDTIRDEMAQTYDARNDVFESELRSYRFRHSRSRP